MEALPWGRMRTRPCSLRPTRRSQHRAQNWGQRAPGGGALPVGLQVLTRVWPGGPCTQLCGDRCPCGRPLGGRERAGGGAPPPMASLCRAT